MGDIYDDAASLYDVASAFIPFERALRAATVNAMAVEKKAAILDVGCGTGLSFPFLFSAVGAEGRVVGVDSSNASLLRASKRAQRLGLPFEAIHGDAAQAPWQGARFSGAIAIFAMSVIPQWEATLRAVVESLLPGASFVVLEQRYATAGPARMFNPVARLLNKMLRADAERDFPGAMTAAGLQTRTQEFHGGWYALHRGQKARSG